MIQGHLLRKFVANTCYYHSVVIPTFIQAYIIKKDVFYISYSISEIDDAMPQ